MRKAADPQLSFFYCFPGLLYGVPDYPDGSLLILAEQDDGHITHFCELVEGLERRQVWTYLHDIVGVDRVAGSGNAG